MRTAARIPDVDLYASLEMSQQRRALDAAAAHEAHRDTAPLLRLPPGRQVGFRLAPGDRVRVEILGNEELSGVRKVLTDGTISLGAAGALKASGLTLPELAAEVQLRLAAYLRTPEIVVTLEDAVSRYVTIVGSLPGAGRVELVGRDTLLDVLSRAGWARGSRSPARFALLRDGIRYVVDLGRVFDLSSDPGQNVLLEPNDIVILLQKDPIRVTGEVFLAGEYALGDRTLMTPREALILAGWHTRGADLSRASILRGDGAEMTVDLNQELYAADGIGLLRLMPGDTLYLPPAAQMGVYVLGMVRNPGLHRRASSMNVMQALALADHERFGAVLRQTKVVRGYPERPEVFTLNLDALLNRGDVSQNLELLDGDIVYVPESTTSDVLDFLNRLLRPTSGMVTTGSSVMDAESSRRELLDQK